MQAISVGYRAFHDALSYCNQAGLGAAVKDSSVKRSELFLMSMVPTYLMGYNETMASVQASLDQMQLTELDLVMIHHRAPVNAFPRLVSPMKAFPNTPIVNGKASWGAPACAIADPSWISCQDETWDALINLKKQGKLRAIGVSNWEIATIQRMIDRGVELPAVNQIETVRAPNNASNQCMTAAPEIM
jgi:diketogulonate reductase-like aldo/keto reductase